MNTYMIYPLSFLTIFFACSNNPKNYNSNPVEEQMTLEEDVDERGSVYHDYNFTDPSKTFILDPELTEVSGLSYDAKNKSLLAINDEKGIFYYLDPITGNLISSQKFGKKGDYESIENTPEEVVIMKNSGDLFFYNHSSGTTKKVKTELSATNDVEGMALSNDQKFLLLACKGQSLLEHKTKKEKCIYAFSLETNTLIGEPFLTIKDEEIIDMYKTEHSKSSGKKIKNRLKSFAPSGIAVHPVSSDIYIISARGSVLLKFNRGKQLEKVILLNSKINPQPEGICFDKDANLYISTEGAGFSGKIFKYNRL